MPRPELTTTPAPPLPRYLPTVLALGARISPGETRQAFVLHDDVCDLLAGAGQCNCSPVVTFGYTLWYRKSKGRGRAWEAVAAAPTEREAWGAIKSSGRRNGDWMVLPADKQP